MPALIWLKLLQARVNRFFDGFANAVIFRALTLIKDLFIGKIMSERSTRINRAGGNRRRNYEEEN